MDIPGLAGQCPQAAWTIGVLAGRLSLKEVQYKNLIRKEEVCRGSSYEEQEQFCKTSDNTVTTGSRTQ